MKFIKLDDIYRPLDCIIDNFRYSKQLDGLWHKFNIGDSITPKNSLGSFIDIGEILIKYRYLAPIIIYTNNVNASVSTISRKDVYVQHRAHKALQLIEGCAANDSYLKKYKCMMCGKEGTLNYFKINNCGL